MQQAILSVDDRLDTTKILAATYEFQSDSASRLRLVKNANLHRFTGNLALSGPPNAAAATVVNKLEEYGELPDRPGYHALGALLAYLLTIEDMPPNDKRFIAQMINKYSLVDDERYVHEMQKSYGIQERSASQSSWSSDSPPHLNIEVTEPPINSYLSEEEATHLERVIHSEDNFLDIYHLYEAIYCAMAVCCIDINGEPKGTGFLVGPDLLITNNHVLPKDDYLEIAIARFDYVANTTKIAAPGRSFKMLEILEKSPAEDLDFSLIRLEERPLHVPLNRSGLESSSIEELIRHQHQGYLTLSEGFIAKDSRVNIIQHPNGNPLKVVLTQNRVVADMTKTRVHYVADTDHGSSGSPVFNRLWEVVALHHSGEPYPPEKIGDVAKKALRGKFRYNEGIPMRQIIKVIEKYLPQ